jgi:hypothetical protein
MNPVRFDGLLRRLAAPVGRRQAAGLVAAALGVRAADSVDAGAAPQAAAGCRNAGKPCKRGSQCCSGVCAGKKGQKRCKPAPNQGICTIADDDCAVDTFTPCGVAGDSVCRCVKTTAGLPFCADPRAFLEPGGDGCASDAECAELIGGGARCIRTEPECFFGLPTCIRPCPQPD